MQVNVSSMGAHTDFLASNANNIANVNTNPFNANQVVLDNSAQGNVKAVVSSTNSPTELSRELTDQIVIENGFDAQIRSIKTEDEMVGTLLDMHA